MHLPFHCIMLNLKEPTCTENTASSAASPALIPVLPGSVLSFQHFSTFVDPTQHRQSIAQRRITERGLGTMPRQRCWQKCFLLYGQLESTAACSERVHQPPPCRAPNRARHPMLVSTRVTGPPGGKGRGCSCRQWCSEPPPRQAPAYPPRRPGAQRAPPDLRRELCC